ncbi:ABC transporter permease [Anaerosporobacter faecicola]|uniref:ABC transporter permease n=1 Tax=Anaerosporobacter faecicola TaxID=2718714 RepID=UPI00143A2A11|nr:FtsX-like permease family protein [Anaerosporobacter faecicola]
MEIITLLKANIKRRKGVFISITLLMLLITMSMTVIISVNDNLKKQMKTALDKADTGDFVAIVPEKNVDDTLLSSLADNSYVDHIRDIKALITLKCTVNGKKIKGYFDLCEYKSQEFEDRVYTKEEKSFQKKVPELKRGEILVPLTFRTMYNCEIGSKCVVPTKAGEQTFIIKGFVEEPLEGAYVITSKLGYIAKEDFEKLQEVKDEEIVGKQLFILPYHVLHIYQKTPHQLDMIAFKKALNDDTKLINYSFGTLSKEDSQEYTLMVPEIFGNILLVFVALLFVIVLIVMGHSISTGIEMDYVNLGVLKALGFTKGKIRLALFLQYLIAEFVGAVVGLVISIPMVKILGSVFQQITGLLTRGDLSLLTCCGIIAGILGVSSVFIFVKTKKVTRISPVRAISGGRDSVYFSNRGMIPIKRSAMGLRLAYKQFTSNRRQYIGITCIVAILIYFLMSITILTKGISVETIYEVFGGIVSDVELDLKDTYSNEEQQEELVNRIKEITPVTFSVFSLNRYITVDGTQYNATIYDDPQEFKSILKGRAPKYANEILVTELVSKTIEKGVGDTVTLAFRDKEDTYVISGIYQSTVEVGKCIGISLEGARKIGEFEPIKGYLRVKDTEKVDEIITMCNETYGDVLTANESKNSDQLSDLIQLSLKVVMGFIYCNTILFALIVVNMVCKKTFLKERQDIGIYKAMGFTVTRLRVQFALRFLLIAVIGTVIGLICNALWNSDMMLILFRYVGITSFRFTYTTSTIFLPTFLVCTCFFLFSYISARKVKSVAVRELVTE